MTVKQKKINIWKDLTRYILIYLIVISIPLITKSMLHAGIPVYVLLILPIVKLLFEILPANNISKIIKTTCRLLSVIFSVLFAVMLLISIIITPHSVYVFFFTTVTKTLEQEFFIANLFVLLISFFCLFFGSASLQQKSYKPLLGLISIVFGLLLLIYQTVLYLILMMIGLLIYLVVVMKKKTIYLAKTFIICIALGLILFMLFPTPEGSGLVDKFLYPETRRFINTYFPQFPLLIDIPGYGLTHSTDTLGGSAILTSAPVFEVQGKRKGIIYLQTNIYDSYGGNSWKQTVKNIQYPGPVKKNETGPVDSEPDIVSVKILTEVFSQVPYTIDTHGFMYNNSYYTIAGDTYIPGVDFAEGFVKNNIITLYRHTDQQTFSHNMNLFLTLPEDLPQSIAYIAAILGQNASSKEMIIQRIQDFLAFNYTYNLDVPDVKKNEDFVENFLIKDKQGYCSHFATAFIILARLNNIPARFVSGYIVYIDTDSYKKIVTARSAHAWPEIWLPGKGWHIWEATRAVNIDYYTQDFDNIYDYLNQYIIQGNEIARNSLTLNQLQDILGFELKFRKDETTGDWTGKVVPLLITIIIVVLIVCLAGGLLYGLIRFVISQKPGQQSKILLNRIVKYYKQVPPPEGRGWVHWKNNLCTMYKIEEKRVKTLLGVILSLAYSNKPVSNDEIKVLKGFKDIFQ